MTQEHFYASSVDGTLLITDNYRTDESSGKELYVEVSSDRGVTVTPRLGFLDSRETSCAGLSREEAIRLRDFLNEWLGE